MKQTTLSAYFGCKGCVKTRSNRIVSGIRARTNGHVYETLVMPYIPKLVLKYDPRITDAVPHLVSSEKFMNVSGKMTTSKADVVCRTSVGNRYISIKMTPSGTQAQIVSLPTFRDYCRFKGFKMPDAVYDGLQSFLGVGGLNRVLITSLSFHVRQAIVEFLTTNKERLIQFCLCHGTSMTPPELHYFIINSVDFTSKREVLPLLCSASDFVEVMKQGECKITRNGSLQLSDYIGLQRKGSGGGSSAECLQFKIRRIPLTHLRCVSL